METSTSRLWEFSEVEINSYQDLVALSLEQMSCLCVQIAHQVGISESGIIQGAQFGPYRHWGLLRGHYGFSVSYHLVFQ